mgnify:CR=1 FL=1
MVLKFHHPIRKLQNGKNTYVKSRFTCTREKFDLWLKNLCLMKIEWKFTKMFEKNFDERKILQKMKIWTKEKFCKKWKFGLKKNLAKNKNLCKILQKKWNFGRKKGSAKIENLGERQILQTEKIENLGEKKIWKKFYCKKNKQIEHSYHEQLRSMQHLGELNLSHNRFTVFDPNFCQLRALRTFTLNNNQLSTMPGML